MDELKKIKQKKVKELQSKKGEVVETTDIGPQIERSVDRLVLVDFYANWCMPCRALGPVLKKLSEEMGFILVKVNVDKAKEAASKFGVKGIPAVFLIKDAKVVDKFTGARDPNFIREKISKWL